MFLAACGGSKSSGSSYERSSRGGGGGGGGGGDWDDDPPPKANELKESREEATKLTEENHKMSREIFELKNRLGLPTDE
jgi:hypothetical protein